MSPIGTVAAAGMVAAERRAGSGRPESASGKSARESSPTASQHYGGRQRLTGKRPTGRQRAPQHRA
jgi:hypothetical protein